MSFGWIGDFLGTNSPTTDWTVICRLLQPSLPETTYLLNHGATSSTLVNDAGYRNANQSVNAIRFAFDTNFTSNPATGSITMYGFPN